MQEMILDGKLNTYRVFHVPSGWTSRLVRLQVRRKFLRWHYWSTVWTGNSWSEVFVEEALPRDIKRWYCKAIEQYEEYSTAWEKENSPSK